MTMIDAVWRDNELVFSLVSRLLSERPDAVSGDMLRELAQGGVDEREAYALLLASACGLDAADNAEHRALYRRYFAGMAARLDAQEYRTDPYARAVGALAARDGAWELRLQRYKPYEAFVRDEPSVLSDGRVLPRLGYFGEGYEYLAALENGREWMLITPNEISTIRPAIEATHGRAVTYGLGLGYYAYMAAREPRVQSVTVVERDERVIRLFSKHILPRLGVADKLRVVRADAFDYARDTAPRERYDTAFVDLWHDPSDGVALYKRMKALQGLCPDCAFHYWIEKTLLLYA